MDGERVNAARVATYGCPNCTMRCGIAVLDDEGRESELDYEPVGLLGPNLDLYDLPQVGDAQLPVRRLRARHDLRRRRARVLRRRDRAGRHRGRAPVRRRGRLQGAARHDRPPRGRDRQPARKRDPPRRAGVRPRVRGLRDAGQGPGDLGLQLQVHPGHGPGLRGQPHRRPPQGVLDHHLRGQADAARVVRAGQGPEDRRPPADPGRAVRVDHHLPLPLGGARLGRGALPDLLQHGHRARTGSWRTSGRSRTGSTP